MKKGILNFAIYVGSQLCSTKSGLRTKWQKIYYEGKAFPLARSLIPGALRAVDKTIERTFMKFAKPDGMLTFACDRTR